MIAEPINSRLWRKFSVFFVIVVLLLFGGSTVLGKYGGGTGEPNAPYQIWDANHMQAIGADANDWDKHFVLMADIDLSQFDGQDGREEFNIIGDGEYVGWPVPSTPFTGVFDGNGHIISGFACYSNRRASIGLFGYVDGENSEIKNLGLTDPDVHVGGDNVGALVGYFSNNGAITNCYAEGGSVSGDNQIGGLVGVSVNGTITNCYSSARVDGGLVSTPATDRIAKSHVTKNIAKSGGVIGASCAGGLLGFSSYSTIDRSYATNPVTGDNLVGGLVGGNISGGIISNSYAKGNVVGRYAAGGLLGYNSEGIISTCYSTGRVTGDSDVGAFIGTNCLVSLITDCHWDIETSSEPNMCGCQDPNAVGCENSYGKTTAEMKRQSTFTDWDFINVWDIGDNQTYPYLRTVLPSDLNKDHITNFLDFCIVAEQWCSEE